MIFHNAERIFFYFEQYVKHFKTEIIEFDLTPKYVYVYQ